MHISTIFLTLLSRFLLFILMATYAVPFLIVLLLPARWGIFTSKFFYWMEYSFCWLLMKISFIKVTYEGEKSVCRLPAVIVANHQSSFDIPLIVNVLDRCPHRWLALADLMKSPILRFILPKVAVLVDMSTPMTGMRTLMQTIKELKESHAHAIIFPEGGRYDDGVIHDFFYGFVILAKKLNRPVVPIFIKNIQHAYPRGSFWVRRVPVTVTVGKPIYRGEDESDEIFHDRIHQWFIEKNEEAQQ